MTASREALLEVLERARRAGFLGAGPANNHLVHAAGFAVSVEDVLGRPPRNFADLGTGGGVPGLALAIRWSQATGILIEVGQRRAAFLREAVEQLGLDSRIEVIEDRAETVGSTSRFREQFEIVTARSFASPAVTAEVGAGLIAADGFLVVSEPPEVDPTRWPAGPLNDLGFAPADLVEVDVTHFAVLPKRDAVPDRFPRPVGRPAKRPLW